MSVKMTPLLIIALFVTIPIIEISLFIQVGSWIGLWPTILLIILTALIGTTLLRLQGQAIFAEAKNSLRLHQFPARSVLEGILLLVCGLLLLTPGFFTDIVGFVLMIPRLRGLLINILLKKAHADLPDTDPSASPSSPPSPSLEDEQTIIEGEFRDL